MNQWWVKYRSSIRSILFPLIIIQFIRTLLFPNPFDVFILFGLFLFYLGFLFNMY